MAIVLGVDGGGSKTHAVVVNTAGHVLGIGRAGGGNHQSSGIERAMRHIRDAALRALQQAGIEPAQVDFVEYGLAGADRARDFNRLRPALASLPFAKWEVVCDTLIGLRTGSPDNVGVVLVCGTDTNAMGRKRNGETVQTGGFGPLFGDAAGGIYLSRATFRAAVRSWEHREVPSSLTDAVPKHLGFATMEQLVNHYLDHDINSVPLTLTLVLHDAAEAGDELSMHILRETGRELGLAANSVAHRLGGFGGAPFPVVLIGSILQRGRSSHLLSALEATVREKHPEATIVIPNVTPVYGAILLGLDRLGLPEPAGLAAQFALHGGDEE